MKFIQAIALSLLATSLPGWTRPVMAIQVDEARLIGAEAEEWLSNGRDYAETHYSPLARITPGNVDRLDLVWTYDTESTGNLEATPLIADGVMYATTTWNSVFALDARTGEELWRWDSGIPEGPGGPHLCCGPVNRGAALYNGKVYVGLLDGRLVALDAETGRVVWSVQTTPRDDERQQLLRDQHGVRVSVRPVQYRPDRPRRRPGRIRAAGESRYAESGRVPCGLGPGGPAGTLADIGRRVPRRNALDRRQPPVRRQGRRPLSGPGRRNR